MSTLVKVTGDDIAELGDADLRELIGLLCEKDYSLAGLSTKGITWSGHQDAKDGGLDIVVRDSVYPPADSHVPKRNTGFQVKKSNMQKAEITKEMCPDGKLRDSIKELIQYKGAYIIVSTASVTEAALRNRINTMKEAVANEDNQNDFHLDFFDRGRVATWVRSHPNLIFWVREKIGKPFTGWRLYENWSNPPGGVEEEYLLDNDLRLYDGAKPTKKGFSVEDGLLELRSALAAPGTSTRLVGLSGVGKTRFAQALFDEKVGQRALNPSQAIYTDISDSPDPDPSTLATQYINDKKRAILIIDNCPPDLHHRLMKISSQKYSMISLLTIEYDVRDDLPEETRVFRLKPASEWLIEKLISNRYTHIGQVDARTIAHFSGGNSRIAIVLANTVQQGETLSGFRDEQLFKRLFWQRHDREENLLVSAQLCSLVYSFEGTDANSEKSELKFLASLADKSGSDLYRYVAEIKERELIQSRGVWRAVLPHAIANRLAKRALKSIPKKKIVDSFHDSSERLLRSFTIRLSYLHDSDEAVEIVNDWLSEEGWIGKSIHNLNDFGIHVLKNIAPVSPEKTLEAIERAANLVEGESFVTRENSHSIKFVRLLKHLAYDADLFNRSVAIISNYVLSGEKNENVKFIRDKLKSLFYIRLSGTHAPFEARAKAIEDLVDSEEKSKQELGLILLDAALEAGNFYSSHELDFGARPRDYGYYPNRQGEVEWFGGTIKICLRLALSDRPISKKARKLLANNLRKLWTNGGMLDALEKAAKKIHEQCAWNDGWIAVHGIIKFDSKNFTDDINERLHALEKLLRPNELLEKARAFVLSDQHGTFDISDDKEDDSSTFHRMKETTRKVGAEVVQKEEILDKLLPDLFSKENMKLRDFGVGLGEGCHDREKLFKSLYEGIKATPTEQRNIDVLLGFLSSCAKADQLFYNSTLDHLIGDDVLGEWFPLIQTTSTIDERGVERLHKALDIGKANIFMFKALARERVYESISDDDLAALTEGILSKEDGAYVALEILSIIFHERKEGLGRYSDKLVSTARNVLSACVFEKKRQTHNNQDYELAMIAGVCLNGPSAVEEAMEICQQLAKAMSENRVYSFNYPQLLRKLAHLQPKVFLDIFLARNDVENYQSRIMFSDYLKSRENPMGCIPDDELLSWCEEDPSSRYSLVLSKIVEFIRSTDTGELEWNPIVYSILEKAPDLNLVINNLADSLRPMSWSGSLAAILQKRAVLFKEFFEHENYEVETWAGNQYSMLQKEIRKTREWEDKMDRERNEKFE